MESIGAEKMFNTTTVVKRNLYHTSFYGDSDSKTFTVVENVYGPEKKVSKLYFGIALRQNTRNLEKMVSACKVSMFHVAKIVQKMKTLGVSFKRTNWKELGYIKIKVDCILMFEQLFFLFTMICVRRKILRNVCIVVPRMQVLIPSMIWNHVPKASHIGYRVWGFMMAFSF